jgi:hypothetical protein
MAAPSRCKNLLQLVAVRHSRCVRSVVLLNTGCGARALSCSTPKVYEINSLSRLAFDDSHLSDFWTERIEHLKNSEVNYRIDTSRSHCIARDKLIRGFLGDCFWWRGPVFNIFKSLLLPTCSVSEEANYCVHWREYRARFPYIFDWPWSPLTGMPPSQGSALLSDGGGCFLALEVGSSKEHVPGHWSTSRKSKTASTLRNRKRKNVKSRLCLHVCIWHLMQSQVLSTEGVGFMDGDMYVLAPLTRCNGSRKQSQ